MMGSPGFRVVLNASGDVLSGSGVDLLQSPAVAATVSWRASASWNLLILLLTAPLAYASGRSVSYIHLPSICGYIVAGLVLGPWVLGWLGETAISDLYQLQHLCLAIIGIMAGAEVNFAEIRRTWWQVGSVTAGICVSTWLLVFAAFWAGSSHYELDSGLTPAQMLAMASLTATLMMARSPASCIAVIQETGMRGQFPSLVLGITVAKDIVVVGAFALDAGLCKALLDAGPSGLSVWALLGPLMMLLAAILLGLCSGQILAWALHWTSGLPSSFALAAAILTVVAGAGGLFAGAEGYGAEGLLCCVMAGVVAANQPGGSESPGPALLEQALAYVVPMNNLLFFTLVGVSVPVGALRQQLHFAVVLFFVRLVAIYIGTAVGGRAAGCPTEQTPMLCLSMITQAGVAMGLAAQIRERFPEWGDGFNALLVTVICLNLTVGPPYVQARSPFDEEV